MPAVFGNFISALICFIISFKWVESLNCPSPDKIVPCRCLVKGVEYQVWCSHSDLENVLNGLKSVSQHISDPIDELILENNFLPSLPGRTFNPMKVLRLMLRHNNLERVSADWLAGLEATLMELFIVEPKLRYLPDDSLDKLNALEAITIQGTDLKRLPRVASLKKLRYVRIESSSLVELNRGNFNNLPLLEKLYISTSVKLNRLEDAFLTDLPSLNLLNISYCGINWIHPRALMNLPSLKEVILIGNKITDAGMVGRAAKDLVSLEVLRLDYNFINKLGEGSFVDLPALKSLHLTNNNILEVHHGALHRVPKLKTIHLDRNLLRRVHPESFLQPSDSGVEELWLQENDIGHVAELKSILDALPRLTFLDLSVNRLEVIPFGSLRGHPMLEVLILNHNRLLQIDKESLMAMPALRELSLKNNSLTNNGQDPLWNLPSLKGLDVSDNYYQILDSNFLSNLPLLRRFDISGNELALIDPMLFRFTPDVEYINLSHNFLDKIHPSTFKHLINLYELDISFNHLDTFASSLPHGIEKLHLSNNRFSLLPTFNSRDLHTLRMLDLSSNLIIEVTALALKSFSRLTHLYMGNNKIKQLDPGVFHGLSKLYKLDLTGNKIAHIHPDSIDDSNNIQELFLADNRVENLLPKLFKKISKLTSLDVSNNQLADIAPDTMENTLFVKYLNLSNNILIKLPPSLSHLHRIETLDVSNNRIKVIPQDIFNKLISLNDLRLSHNFIQDVKMRTFENLKNLQLLFLNDNELENLETNCVQSLPKLELLRIDQNKLTHLPPYTFHNLTMLQVVELQENMLKSIAPNAFSMTPNVLLLNLSHNQLSNLEEAGLQGVTSLEILDLSFNRIRNLIASPFEKMEWIVELNFDNNVICSVHDDAFRSMSRLRVLTMRNNNLRTVSENLLDRIRPNIGLFDVDGNPLDCDCNLRWLQAWSKDSYSQGPRCKDGNYLRKKNLKSIDCKPLLQQDSGCSEAATNYGTSQIFSKYTRLQNISKDEHGNYLAPLPQESDYFYDEYVDYPFNDTSDKLSLQSGVKSGSIHTTVSPHLTPGDTPTIYAAAKNRTKPDIPKEVQNSPSSSGFTFFGVPLPSLNKLWGGGKAKMDTKGRVAAVPNADRKTAIVNTPRANRIGFNPPSTPEIQIGGFVPVLPGSGGFTPIVGNPFATADEDSVRVTSEVAPTESPTVFVKHINNATNAAVLGSSVNPQNVTARPASEETSTYVIEKPTSSTASYDFIKAEKKHTKLIIEPVAEKINDEIYVVESLAQSQVINSTKVLPEKISNTSEPNGKNATSSGASPLKTIASAISTSTIGPPSAKLPLEHRVLENKHHDAGELNLRNSESVATPVSTFVVPKNNQNVNRPVGRSRITKVQSPHSSLSADMIVKDVGDLDESMLVKREGKKDEVIGEDKGWYFANYNKTYVEPFVGGGVGRAPWGIANVMTVFIVFVNFYIH